MLWDRERYLAHAQFEDTGREMFCELFGPLHVLENEWRTQGAAAAEIGMKAFDWDYVPVVWLSGNTGAITGIASKTLQDDPEITLGIDRYGRRTKLIKKTANIALPMDYPVETPDDWMKIKHWYTFSENRVNREALQQQKKRSGSLLFPYSPNGLQPLPIGRSTVKFWYISSFFVHFIYRLSINFY